MEERAERNDKRERVSFKIQEQLAVLTKKETGWTRELNLVRWNGGRVKYDVRDWNPDHTRMSKGLTFYREEMEALVEGFTKHRLERAGARAGRSAGFGQESFLAGGAAVSEAGVSDGIPSFLRSAAEASAGAAIGSAGFYGEAPEAAPAAAEDAAPAAEEAAPASGAEASPEVF